MPNLMSHHRHTISPSSIALPISAPAPAQNLRFRFQSVGYARSLSFTTNGVDAAGAPVTAV